MSDALHFGLVAGEASGDLLGEALMLKLVERFPDARFSGVGGARMIKAGLDSLYDMDRLSVMGFVEPLKRLPELLSMRRHLVRHFLRSPVDVFVGIDSPDFNLGIAKRLHRQGLPTVQYVSPSVWAWRQGRIKSIRASVDLMLTLFPFESRFYESENVPVRFVGHPLAAQINAPGDRAAARAKLGLSATVPVVALMPGSRHGEVDLLLPPFVEAGRLMRRARPDMQFLIPAANDSLFRRLTQQTDLPGCHVLPGQAALAVTAADAVLLASGTSSLEVMLLQRPMVVAYRLGNLTYQIARRLVKTPYISIPNLLAQQALVPEYVQDQVEPQELARQILRLVIDPRAAAEQVSTFESLGRQLGRDSAGHAAVAIAELLKR